jgi:hypothetical protein
VNLVRVGASQPAWTNGVAASHWPPPTATKIEN